MSQRRWISASEYLGGMASAPWCRGPLGRDRVRYAGERARDGLAGGRGVGDRDPQRRLAEPLRRADPADAGLLNPLGEGALEGVDVERRVGLDAQQGLVV